MGNACGMVQQMNKQSLERLNCELLQEIRMLKRIIVNLKRALRESKRTHKHKYYARWSADMKEDIIRLRDNEKKDFSEISEILNLSNRQCRNLYAASSYAINRR